MKLQGDETPPSPDALLAYVRHKGVREADAPDVVGEMLVDWAEARAVQGVWTRKRAMIMALRRGRGNKREEVKGMAYLDAHPEYREKKRDQMKQGGRSGGIYVRMSQDDQYKALAEAEGMGISVPELMRRRLRGRE